MALEQTLYHVTLEVENSQCKGLQLMFKLGVNDCRLIDVRRLPEGSVRHLVQFPAGELKKASLKNLKILKGSKSSVLASFKTDGCSVCNTMLSQGAFLISGRHVEGYRMVYEFIAPGYDVFKQIISTLESLGFKLKVLGLTKQEHREGVLTEKQENALWLSLKMGYFDTPRKVSTRELAKMLGIVPSTFSEITRSGIRKLLEKYFESKTF
jgi:predicted DNA binding protein